MTSLALSATLLITAPHTTIILSHEKTVIKVTIKYGFDRSHKSETPLGTLYGKELSKEIKLTNDEAREVIQSLLDKMEYQEAAKFAEKYSK